MRRVAKRALLLLAAVLLSAGCSVTTGGFVECEADSDCQNGRICRQNYCVVNQTPQGCGRTEGRVDAANAIPLGVAIPLTRAGVTDESEVQGLNAVLLALEEVNQREGVGGRPFALHICDSQADDELIKLQAAWLADAVKAPAMITSGSGQTISAASVTVGKGMMIMTATATSPELTATPDSINGSVGLVWRTAPSDAIQGKVIADMLLNPDTAKYPELAGVTKVGVVYLNDPYGQGLANVLIEEFSTQTVKSILPIQYDEGGNIDNAVNQLNNFDPDLTVLIAFPDDAVRILNAAATTANLGPGAHRWFFTDSAKDPSLISRLTVTNQVEGAYGTAPAQGAGAAYIQFASSFQSRFNVDPGQFSFTSHSYDAMYLLALGSAFAVGENGDGEVSGSRIAEGLTKVSSGSMYQLKPSDFTFAKAALQKNQSIDVMGASGSLNFDAATGEAPSPIEVWKVQGSGFEFVENRTPPGS